MFTNNLYIPKTMHWISLILTKLLKDEASDIIEILEESSQTKVNQSKFISVSGFGFDRIVFTILTIFYTKTAILIRA